jgi:hypothetical protein
MKTKILALLMIGILFVLSVCQQNISCLKGQSREIFSQFSRGVNFHRITQRIFESIYKTVLAHESGDPGVQFDEKKPEVENLVTLSL